MALECMVTDSAPRRRWVRALSVTAVALLWASTGRATPPEGNGESEVLQIPPVVEREGPDGDVHPERGGAWKYRAPRRLSSRGESKEEDRKTKHQVVFLLDISKSMPAIHGSAFDRVLSEVEERARKVLRPYRGTGLIEVSFFRFGDLRENDDGDWEPHVRPSGDGVDLSADEALSRMDEFFTEDSSDYRDEYTYVAASVYETTAHELEVPITTDESIPDSAPRSRSSKLQNLDFTLREALEAFDLAYEARTGEFDGIDIVEGDDGSNSSSREPPRTQPSTATESGG